MSQQSGLPPLPATVHFVGIGGIGMSGLARILKTWGYRVTGSDAFASDLIEQLRAEEISVRIGHEDTADALAANLVVATAALRETNPEVHAARNANIPIIKRAELLGMLANSRRCVAVAGSHGKSSTSGMLVSALQAAGRDPSYAVGAVVATTGTNAAPGSGAEMVVEADEYDYSFLWLRPDVAIITNIDYDHPDLFPDHAAYDRAFVRFAKGARRGGVLIVNGDDEGVARVLPELRAGTAPVVAFGASDACDWRIDGTSVRSPDGQAEVLDLRVPGRHNFLNATAALVAMRELGVDFEVAARALGAYQGVGRRFETKGEAKGVTVVDDYAHHPSEILATIAAARDRFPGRRIVAAFQPHTYSRTRALLDPFAHALQTADLAMVLDIYPARETDSLGVSANDILRRLKGTQALPGGKPADAAGKLAAEVRAGDVVLTMGAGDITLVGPKVLRLLETRP